MDHRPKYFTLTRGHGQLRGEEPCPFTDAAEAVRKAGYRTNSSHFRDQVNMALLKGGFKRVGRGMYTAG